MQQTKFWHELTEQQQRFLSLLASGKAENIELAKQFLLGILREKNGGNYLEGVDFLNKHESYLTDEEYLLLDSFESEQRDFFAEIGLPLFFLNKTSETDVVTCLPFDALSKNINYFSCSRRQQWKDEQLNKYLFYSAFDVSHLFFIKGRIENSVIYKELAEFKRFMSYPFGYKGAIIYTFYVPRVINRDAINAIAFLCSELLKIEPAMTFRFLRKDGLLNSLKFLDHDIVLKILEKVPQQKNWLMYKESIRVALLPSCDEPKPNPLYLVLQNTCFYLRKDTNGGTNPEYNDMNILSASPEWKERNLTYKFID